MGSGKKLQDILKENGKSIAQLSRDTGISSNTLYAIIKRDSNINSSTIYKISESLKIPANELLKKLSDNTENIDSVETKKPHYLNNKIETLSSDRELIEYLNQLTQDYNKAVDMSMQFAEMIEAYEQHLFLYEQRIVELKDRKRLLENEIENRKVELEMVRKKLSEIINSPTPDN